MLVLSRLPMERVVIDAGGKRITVSVIEVRGNKVRLGFAAAPEIKIDREELATQKAAKLSAEAGSA